jgi:hypothetical protein
MMRAKLLSQDEKLVSALFAHENNGDPALFLIHRKKHTVFPPNPTFFLSYWIWT